jgi:Flp pilus assembly protein TadD
MRFRPVLLVATVAVGACSRADTAPKTPLGQATPAAAVESSLPPAARSALDRGNAEYRAGRYESALGAYREASRAAPGDASPFFGIYMAAQKLGKQGLADSASKLIQVLSAADAPVLSDSSMRKLHAGPK